VPQIASAPSSRRRVTTAAGDVCSRVASCSSVRIGARSTTADRESVQCSSTSSAAEPEDEDGRHNGVQADVEQDGHHGAVAVLQLFTASSSSENGSG
jgi:hypothetical protein